MVKVERIQIPQNGLVLYIIKVIFALSITSEALYLLFFFGLVLNIFIDLAPLNTVGVVDDVFIYFYL